MIPSEKKRGGRGLLIDLSKWGLSPTHPHERGVPPPLRREADMADLEARRPDRHVPCSDISVSIPFNSLLFLIPMNKNKQVGKGRNGPQESSDVEAGSKKNPMRAAGPRRP